MTETCEKCKFFLPERTGVNNSRGYCRKESPKIVSICESERLPRDEYKLFGVVLFSKPAKLPVATLVLNGICPRTDKDNYCGDFESKEQDLNHDLSLKQDVNDFIDNEKSKHKLKV